jgi:hypothetical protein
LQQNGGRHLNQLANFWENESQIELDPSGT